MAKVELTALVAGRVDYAENTIASGENLTAGAVLGRITASGQYKQVDITAADGTETAVCVLAQDTDASGGALAARCIVAGRVNGTQLNYTGSETVDSNKASNPTHREGLADNGIFVVITDASVAQER